MSQYPDAQFLLSADAPAQFPPDTGIEVAVAGRSNAGKSSAINVIVNRRQFARTSKTPGRTREIHFFRINTDFVLADPELAEEVDQRGGGDVHRPTEPVVAEQGDEQRLGGAVGGRGACRGGAGVVEATETTDPDRFLIGVQWHPEKLMPDNTTQAKLIEAFIEAAAREKAKR